MIDWKFDLSAQVHDIARRQNGIVIARKYHDTCRGIEIWYTVCFHSASGEGQPYYEDVDGYWLKSGKGEFID